MKFNSRSYWLNCSIIFIASIILILGNVSSQFNPTSAVSINSKDPGSTVVLTEDMNIKYFGEKKDDFAYITSGTYVNGEYWVIDNFNDRLGIFSSEGKYLNQFNNSDFGENVIDQPVEILNNGSHVLIFSNFHVSIFDFNGSYITKFGHEAGFEAPPNAQDLAFNGTHYFLLDSTVDKVHTYYLNGTAGPINSFDKVDQAGGIEIVDDYYYITDEALDTVHIYDQDLNHVRTFGSSELVDPKGIFVYENLIYVTNLTSIIVYDDNYNVRYTLSEYNGENFTELIQIKMVNGKIMTTNYPYLSVEGSTSYHPGMQIFNVNIDQISTTVGSDNIRVSWNMPTGNIEDQIHNYAIYRGENPNDLHRIATVPYDQAEYIDTVVQKGKTYFYAVSIINQHGETALSDVVSTQIPNTFNVGNETITLNGNETVVTVTESKSLLYPFIFSIVPMTVILILKLKNRD